MNPPTLVTAFDSLIKVSWLSITSREDTGADDIISYELSYKLSTASTFRVLVDDLVNDFSQTSQTSSTSGWTWGATYTYRARARNSLGYGAYSTTLNVLMPAVPSVMTSLQCTSKSVSSIDFTWSELVTDSETGRATILSYEIRFRLSTSSNDLEWVSIGSTSS
jgi:hypothetical protein